jgi:hypothetical protein
VAGFLVGVVSADIALQWPDFRAAENTFQVLTQVAGRAGRGDSPGTVLVQTFNPEHYSIRFARMHDYSGFFKEEMAFRRELGYPPYRRLILFHLAGNVEEKTLQASGGRSPFPGQRQASLAPAAQVQKIDSPFGGRATACELGLWRIQRLWCEFDRRCRSYIAHIARLSASLAQGPGFKA